MEKYNSGNGAKSIRGVGIIAADSTDVTFNFLSERICIIVTKISNNIKCYLISTYTPTLDNTMRNSDETCIFYKNN